MTYESATQLLAFVLPISFAKAELTLSKLADSVEEFHINFSPGKSARHIVSTAQLAKGKWRARLNWTERGLRYHEEKDIVIQ